MPVPGAAIGNDLALRLGPGTRIESSILSLWSVRFLWLYQSTEYDICKIRNFHHIHSSEEWMQKGRPSPGGRKKAAI